MQVCTFKYVELLLPTTHGEFHISFDTIKPTQLQTRYVKKKRLNQCKHVKEVISAFPVPASNLNDIKPFYAETRKSNYASGL